MPGMVAFAQMPIMAGISANGIVRIPAMNMPPLALRRFFAPKSALVTLDEARKEIAEPSALATTVIQSSPTTLK